MNYQEALKRKAELKEELKKLFPSTADYKCYNENVREQFLEGGEDYYETLLLRTALKELYAENHSMIIPSMEGVYKEWHMPDLSKGYHEDLKKRFLLKDLHEIDIQVAVEGIEKIIHEYEFTLGDLDKIFDTVRGNLVLKTASEDRKCIEF